MGSWAIDLGNTNTGVAAWNAAENRPHLVELGDVCRRSASAQADPLEAPRLVPSATRVLDHLDFQSRLGKQPFFLRHFFLGKQAVIGRPALEMQEVRPWPSFVPTFKRVLEREPLRPLARNGRNVFTARDIGRLFIRELFAEVKRVTGERIRDAVFTAPVDAFETYRAEVGGIAKQLGVKKVRFLDEPVAAALGYGLTLQRTRNVLVVDFGGGTMHAALVRVSPKSVEGGACEVIAKEGRPVGGNLVDLWILRELCKRADYPLHEDSTDDATQFWVGQLREEACRVKEGVFFREQETFHLTPPEDLRSVEARLRGAATELKVGRQDVVDILRANGLYTLLDECLDLVERAAETQGIPRSGIDDVLMVGGSSLLPEIYSLVEKRFGRDRVRAWQPFEAVAYGGAVFAAGAFEPADFIVHDYAFVTHDARTHQPQYTVIVPRGTRFPTAVDFWKRQLVPTCSLGEPETLFKLVVCEIGDNGDRERRFGWDASGNLHKLGGSAEGRDNVPLIVPLNESNPTLGFLRPPHAPNDKRPRLEISFEVDADRWLCATVIDLFTRRNLMKAQPVVRLL